MREETTRTILGHEHLDTRSRRTNQRHATVNTKGAKSAYHPDPHSGSRHRENHRKHVMCDRSAKAVVTPSLLYGTIKTAPRLWQGEGRRRQQQKAMQGGGMSVPTTSWRVDSLRVETNGSGMCPDSRFDPAHLVNLTWINGRIFHRFHDSKSFDFSRAGTRLTATSKSDRATGVLQGRA